VRPQDAELTKLLNESFVPVRLVNMKDVDLNFFQFDYDLTFAVLMMNANGYVYSRFGSMDGTHTTDRMSVEGLKHAMRAVRSTHPTRVKAVPPLRLPPTTLNDLPAFAQSKQAGEACYHCHFVGAFRFKQLRVENKFTKAMVHQFPLPENIGITLDVDKNNLVKAVTPESPADQAGVRTGDVLVNAIAPGQVGALNLYTAADLQFALNEVADPGFVLLHVLRAKERITVSLKLPSGWRKHDVSWRSSQATFAPTVGVWGMALSAEEKRARGIAADRMAVKVTFFFNGPEWVASRGALQLNDVIVGINGETLPSMTIRQFHSHFRLNFNVGDTVTLNVLRGDRKLDLPVPCTKAGDGEV